MDAAGTLVGTLSDIDSNPTSGQVLSLVVHKGGLLGLGGETTTIDASAILGIGAKVITVSEVAGASAS